MHLDICSRPLLRRQVNSGNHSRKQGEAGSGCFLFSDEPRLFGLYLRKAVPLRGQREDGQTSRVYTLFRRSCTLWEGCLTILLAHDSNQGVQ